MINESIKRRDISRAVWAACGTFRGVKDAAEYKDYILVMFFLKYISDLWKERYEEYSKRYGDDDTLIRSKLDRECFILPKGTSYYDLYDRRNESNIGELINIALDAVETANKSKLEGVFRNIDFNLEANLGKTRDRNRLLKILLEDFYKPQLDMRPSHISEEMIGNVYIYLIERFATYSGKKTAAFYTPYKVSELIAKLSKPKVGARICDPACGSGELLIEAAKAVGDQNCSIYGMEVNGNTWALCRLNMFIHGADSARIEWCNALTSPTLVANDRLMKFDNIVANPPFSLDKWGADEAEADTFNRFWRGVPPKSNGDYAFISHMIETAVEKKGRVVVIVPHGVLFRGAAEGRIREKLIKENLLDTVISLPGNLFSGSSIPVAVLIFDRSRENGGANESRKDVLFIDASRDYQPGKNQNTLLDKHIEKILTASKERKDVKKYAHPANFEELKENDFNLNVPRYVDTSEEGATIDIEAVQQEITTLESQLNVVRKKMDSLLKRMSA